MGILVIASFIGLGVLGSWIAKQKKRNPTEGFLLGLLFPVLGVLVEALLPNGTYEPQPKKGTPMSIDDQGLVAFIADRYRTALDETGDSWQQWPTPKKRSWLKPLDRDLQSELKLSPTKYSELAAAARRLLVQGSDV